MTHLNRLKLEQTLLDTEVDSIIYYEEPLGNPHKAVIEVNTQVVKLRYLLIYIESSAEHLQPEYAESVATRCRAAVATINQFADLKYGLVTWMPQASSPYIYFHEHISRPITANERRNLEAWFSQGQNYEHKIRGLYWANLFSSQHLAAIGGMFEFENAIGSQLPKDSVLVLEENKVFFTVPTKMRETVKSILESCGLII